MVSLQVEPNTYQTEFAMPLKAEIDLVVNERDYFDDQARFDSFLGRGYRLLVVNDKNDVILIKGEIPRSAQEQADAEARFNAMDAEARREVERYPRPRMSDLSSYFDI
jgi:hypothetical protein